MEFDEYREKLFHAMQENGCGERIGEDLYYFILGQFLICTFDKLGGWSRHTRELNYLTSPDIPKDMNGIGSRVMAFFEKFAEAGGYENRIEYEVYELLQKYGTKYIKERINSRICEDAFYTGLYGDNIIKSAFGSE